MGNTTQDDQFYQYIRMLNFLEKNNNPDLFTKWHSYFDKMMVADYENYQKFIGFSQDFFIDKCLSIRYIMFKYSHLSI